MSIAAAEIDRLPYEVYGQDGWEGYVPGGTRNQARMLFCAWTGDLYMETRATRCYLRPATVEEAREKWGTDYGAIGCPPGHPDAIPSWCVEAPL